jgi:hypothetical protein
MTEDQTCRSCGHAIDAAAKICPYCGADPSTGEKVDIKPLVQEHFPPRPQLSIFDRFMGLVRARQGIVVTAIIIAAVLLLGGLHQFAQSRNRDMGDAVPAVPLTEITDLNRQSQAAELPIPDLPFAYDGNAKTMQTYLMEPGAVTPVVPAAPAATTPGGPLRPGAQPSNVAAPVAPPQPRR